jgi:cytochrome c biogenesis protein CcmG, thiol:disulfide interchange protein DsbE
VAPRSSARSRPPSGASPRRLLLYVGTAVVVGALLFAAFGLDNDTGPDVDEVAGSPSVSGQDLPPLPDGEDPALGTTAPVTTGAGFDGQERTIGDDGAELVVFLASWCPACQAELPELVEWMQAGGPPDDVELTAVVTGLDPDRPNWPPQDWLEEEGYDGATLIDDADGSVAQAYGLSGTPFWVVLRDGEVVSRAAGQVPMEVVDQVATEISTG